MEFLLNPLIQKEEWNKFVAENSGSFLQSFEWGEFQQKSGKEVTRVCVQEDGRILLVAQIMRYSLPLGKNYIYIPYGPVISKNTNNSPKLIDFLVSELRQSNIIGKGTIFLKIEPDENFVPDLTVIGLNKSDKDIQARETLILDISKPEKELLAQMKQKTRYNIRLAHKHGVRIVSIADLEKSKEIFLNLLEETSKRQNFRLHPKKYYMNMMNMFLDKPARPDGGFALRLFFAQYQKKIIAVALASFFNGRATYLHGASLQEYKNVMAPSLLHWEIIKAAKHLGFSEYDFWGIVTDKTDSRQRQKWEGFSRFKMGFGGRIVEYQGAYDLIFGKLWYNAYRIVRKLPIPNF